MTSVLRQLQAEWNTLVPQAQERGIRRVRLLNAPLETIAYRRAKLEWLRAQIGTSNAFDSLSFGVEIECIIPRRMTRQSLADAITAAGVECISDASQHTTRRTWKVVYDGSLTYGSG